MVGECVEGECVKGECDVGGERKGWEGEGGMEEGEGETDCAPFTPPRLEEMQVDARSVRKDSVGEEEGETWVVSVVRSDARCVMR